jgi:hypothetical protein
MLLEGSLEADIALQIAYRVCLRKLGTALDDRSILDVNSMASGTLARDLAFVAAQVVTNRVKRKCERKTGCRLLLSTPFKLPGPNLWRQA